MSMFLSVKIGSYNFKISYEILIISTREKSIVITKRIRQKYQSIPILQDIQTQKKDSGIRNKEQLIYKTPKTINKMVIVNS